MSASHARFLSVVAAAAVLVTGVTPAAAKSYSAERFDVTAQLLTDRSLAVEERIVFRFEGGDYTYVFREIPLDRSDGIADIAAGMDGDAQPAGSGPGSIEVRQGQPIRITWHFQPTSGTHTFTLRYRIIGVVSRTGSDDVLAWHALPRKHVYSIGEANVTLRLPPSTRLVERPVVTPESARVSVDSIGEGKPFAERMTISARGLGENRSIRLDLRLAGGTLASSLPAWQRAADERGRRGPWLLFPAGAILLLGLAWLAASASAWRRSTTLPSPSGAPDTSPPDPGLPIAFASSLAAGRAHTMPAAAATMIDLAARGLITIDEAPRRLRVGRRRFVVRLVNEPPGLRPHESAWLDVAFGTPTSRAREAALDSIQRRFARTRNAFGRTVQDDLLHAGLVDPDRLSARRSLVRAALVTALFTVAGAGVALLISATFGAWAAVIPVSFGLVALAFALTAGRFSVFSPEGERLARGWKTYFAGLRRAARTKDTAAGAVRAEWLPYAVAAGVGAAWVRKLAAMPGRSPLPAWFHAADTGSDQGGAAFAAFIGTHADSGAGGGAGGGAAGGGASGAG